VVLVVILFLQTWRASIIPLLAVPVSLIGTFAVMHLFGFSLNALSLFGLVLAIGIVVDDAIVVVENVERNIELGLNAVRSDQKAMREVTGPIIATALVLCAVFVPAAFISGLTGQFYKQFALTIAISTVISAFNSLTLSPALAAVLLKATTRRRTASPVPRQDAGRLAVPPVQPLLRPASHGYVGGVRRVIRGSGIALFAVRRPDGADLLRFLQHPTGFVPAQDKQYLVAFAQLPDAASWTAPRRDQAHVRHRPEATRRGKRRGVPGPVDQRFHQQPEQRHRVHPEAVRRAQRPEHVRRCHCRRLNASTRIQEAYIAIFPPPPVQGLGTIGGFRLQIEDRGNLGYDELYKKPEHHRQEPQRAGTGRPVHQLQVNVPQVDAAIDREKAKTHGVPSATSSTPCRSTWVRCMPTTSTASAAPIRSTCRPSSSSASTRPDRPAESAQQQGRDDPAGDLHQGQRHLGPGPRDALQRLHHRRNQRRRSPRLQLRPGRKAIEKLLKEELPNGMTYEWTDLTYQQILSGNTALFVFPLCVLLAFLVLAAQYESWSLPLAVILIVPMTLLSAITGVIVSGGDNNIFTQIGLIVLVGLACKNAILIVEFAKDKQLEGLDPLAAVLEACRLRLRPILMTSFAFIMGVVPLVFSSGAGAEMRHAMGVAVFSGMLG
jgi:multidrug efflux pump